MATSSAALKTVIGEHWKGLPAGVAAIQIISSIEALEAPAEKWSLTDILALLGPTAEFKDACQGLAILLQAEYAIFRSVALFVDEKMQSHRLSVEDVQRVLDQDMLAHPVTGVTVTNASEHLVTLFELIPGVLGFAQPSSH